MARQLADAAPSAAPAAGRRVMTRKIVVALGLVLVGQALFALCLVSAQQLLVPRNMAHSPQGRCQGPIRVYVNQAPSAVTR